MFRKRQVQTDRFNEVLDRLRREFPGLRIHEDPRLSLGLDAWAGIPPQPGLDLGLTINLQNYDELHLNVGAHFWVEWFPCSDQDVVDQFVNAISGLIAGNYRIVEYLIGDGAVKAKLQRPIGPDAWQTIATWSNLRQLIPWPRTRRILRNSARDSQAGRSE